MAESDCEIEYLDEDAEIVQQCFQTTQPQEFLGNTLTETNEKRVPLLVERTEKRRKRKKDDDSDYDPNEDYAPPSPPSPSPKNKKKRGYVLKRPKLRNPPSEHFRSNIQKTNVQNVKIIVRENTDKGFSIKEQFINRKKLNIRIPDYEDPLCLPVKAVQQDASDVKRLNVWNNVCLEHFKHCDTLLRPERGEAKSSSRSVVLRNVANRQTAKVETTIWSKTSVVSEEGEKKSEIFQCILPKYKEKKTFNSFIMSSRKLKPFRHVDEVVLTKEDHKDGEALIVYKPRESLSSVYTLHNKKSSLNESELASGREDIDSKMYMKEMTCCKVCAHCFQTSYRGTKRVDSKNILCPICGRNYVTLYNYLSHFKTHSSIDVKKYKKVISSNLAQLVEYHYKCRVCLNKFNSIKQLRQHVSTHQGKRPFLCEVGNHYVT